MIRRLQQVLILAFLLLLPILDAAQVSKPLGKIKEVHFAGLHRYSQADILAATGLAAGQTITEGDLKGAANHLGSTGAFSDIAYNYSTLAGTIKVQFQITEADKLLAVRFENFAWWSDAELRAKLRERVPLFKDELPVAGTLADSVADALQAMVSEREIPGNVQYSRYAKEGGPVEALVYRIEGSAIRVHSLEFPGANPEELPELRSAARKQLVGQKYSASQIVIISQYDFRDVYLRRGYLDVKFGAPSATVAPVPAPAGDAGSEPDPDDAKPTGVIVKLPVEPGIQFLLSTVDWVGNQAFPASALEKFVTVQPGQPANLLQLQQGLEQMKKLYSTRGYMKIESKVESHLDPAAKTASFTVHVKEGAVYHFGELNIEGLEKKAAALLRDQWTIRPGEPFDTSYEARFLKDTQPDLPPGTKWSIVVEEHVNESDKSVDLTIRYVPAISK